MVKQFGIPTFFLALSYANIRWNSFAEITQKLNVVSFDLWNLSYHERCNILHTNPFLVARYLQYRVELLFKLIVIDGPLGKSRYYATRVDFQIC